MRLDQTCVYVVDDDQDIRNLLHKLMTSVSLPAKSFSRAKEFLAYYSPNYPGCLITDLRLPEMSGLELQKTINEKKWNIPVVFLSAFGDIPIVVRVMKEGALDFIEKPFDTHTLLESVQKAIALDTVNRKRYIAYVDVSQRLSRLTRRERQVFNDVVSGSANKQMAAHPEISEKTVEAHRARLMEKMEARSLADLVKMAVVDEQYRENTSVFA